MANTDRSGLAFDAGATLKLVVRPVVVVGDVIVLDLGSECGWCLWSSNSAIGALIGVSERVERGVSIRR